MHMSIGVPVLTCLSPSSLIANRKQLPVLHEEYACFPPFKSRTNWSRVLS